MTLPPNVSILRNASWSPDGKLLAYSADGLPHGYLGVDDGSKLLDAIPPGGKDVRLVERPVTGDGAVRELAKPPGMGRLEDISSDGKTLLLSRVAMDTAVFSIGLDGVQKDPKPLVQTGEVISHTRFSMGGGLCTPSPPGVAPEGSIAAKESTCRRTQGRACESR